MDSLFSFPVGLFHPLQHAGLSRRTRVAHDPDGARFHASHNRTVPISAAIGLGGSLESLVAQLTVVESEIKTLKPVNLTAETDIVRRFALENVVGLRRSLRSEDIPAARTTLQRYIKKLVLTPSLKEGSIGVRGFGNMNLLPIGAKGVMELVARDGIEPPTPAFSGLRSTD